MNSVVKRKDNHRKHRIEEIKTPKRRQEINFDTFVFFFYKVTNYGQHAKMQAARFFMKTFLDSLDHQFLQLHQRSCAFVERIPNERLFWKPRKLEHTFKVSSCGEYILRSAAAVEQTFGGITTTLWDDPFEWTLPEKLATPEKILEYLAEVEATRLKGFGFFMSDAELSRRLRAPDRLSTIFELLLQTLSRADHFQGRAFVLFQMFSDEKLPRI